MKATPTVKNGIQPWKWNDMALIPTSQETPNLESVIQRAIDFNLSQVNTCLPGIVTRYDHAKQQADVQPALKKKYQTGEVVSLPVIPNVPVAHPRAGQSIVHMPIAVGDTVLLIFSQRSLDKWLSSGGQVDPEDARKFHLSDAFAIPGGYAFSNPVTIEDNTSLWVVNQTSKFRLQPGGKFQLKGTDGEELVKIVKDLVQECENILTNTMLGPQPPVNKSAFTAIKSRVNKLVV